MIDRDEIMGIQLFYLRVLAEMVGDEGIKLFDQLIDSKKNENVLEIYNALKNFDKQYSVVQRMEKIIGKDEFTARAYPDMATVFSIVNHGEREKNPVNNVEQAELCYSWQYISEYGVPGTSNSTQPHKYKNDFIEDVKRLCECRYYDEGKLDIFMQKYGSFIAWGKDKHYISVYHRMKTNISILSVLEENDDCLLIGADLSGIQDFIYTISSESALKTLRARSFYLECLVEHTASQILERLGLSRYSLIYSGGGGFYILAKGGEKSREYIRKLYEDVNRHLFYLFQGGIYMAIETVSVPVSSLTANSIQDLSSAFTTLAERMQRQKLTKYRFMLDEVLEIRDPEYEECNVCHSGNMELHTGSTDFDGPVCPLCSRFVSLGKRLKDSKYRFIGMGMETVKLRDGKEASSLRIETSENPEEAGTGYYTLNSFNLEDYTSECKGNIMAGNYSYGDLQDRSIDFDGFAELSRGAKLIGALRMDVDDLGSLFSKRIGAENRRLEVYAALSYYLNLFFKYYLNRICGGELDHQFEVCNRKEEGRKVSIVYSGGDDLFITGSWDDIAELGFDIRDAFREFIGGDNVTLSGGMTIHKPKFPLYQMAELSKKAEGRAKNNEFDTYKKDSYCMFYSGTLDASVSAIEKHNKKIGRPRKDIIKGEFFWKRTEDVQTLTKTLFRIIQSVPQNYVHKLFQVIDIYRYEGEFYMPYMYRIVMNIQREIEGRLPDAGNLIEVLKGLYSEDSSEEGISSRDMNILHIPLTWAEYLNREK